jgi:polyhydroxyalkanoate synthesis regulator phasin
LPPTPLATPVSPTTAPNRRWPAIFLHTTAFDARQTAPGRATPLPAKANSHESSLLPEIGPIVITDPDDSSGNGPGHHNRRPRSLCWGAILAGAVGALAIHIVLMMLGAGLGLALYNPVTSDDPVANLGTGAIVLQGVAAVLSLWGGGWLAGRFSGRRAAPSSGCLHGLMVWCVATVAALFVISTGAGWAMGSLSNVVGGGLSMAGKPAAAAAGGAADLAQEALGRESDMLESFLNEGLSSSPDNHTAGEAIRAKRDLGFSLARLAAADPDNQAEREQKVVSLLVDTQDMSEAEARQMIDDWSATFAELKADLEDAKETVAARAREAADETAKTLAILSLVSFVAFIIGAAAASFGGKHGCMCACRDEEVVATKA